MSTIPATSNLAKELQLLNSLDHIFALASLNASTTHTKAELDARLEGWRLNTSSQIGLIDSIGTLKTLVADAEGFDYSQGDQQKLYALMIRRVKREKLSALVDRNLEEARIRIEQEYDPITLHEIFLAALKGAVSTKPKITTVHQMQLDGAGSPPPPTSLPSPPKPIPPPPPNKPAPGHKKTNGGIAAKGANKENKDPNRS